MNDDPAVIDSRIDEDRRLVEALSEISQAINTLREPGEVLETVLEIALERLEAERGFILLRSDNAPDGYEVRSYRNFTEEELDDLVLSTSVIQEVLQKGEPELVYEAMEDERYSSAESIVLQQIQSIACLPLCRKEEQIGVLYLDSVSQRSRFTRESLPFLQALANQAAIAIENAELYQSLREDNRHLRREIHRIHGFDEIVGDSDPMEEVFETMSRVMDTDASVLIEGESGTGKELVARAIHYNGHRKDEPFVTVFCGSLPDELLESELFGHKKGAFTGAVSDKKGLLEEADGGTVFLDEVSDLSPRMQTVLLRTLQEGEIKRVGENKIRTIDVRILSATNRPLKDLIDTDEFREDLYYRLNTIRITLPPLRNRRSDIPLLAQYFLDKYATGRRDYIRGFEPDALRALKRYPWPGNVRELEKTVERAVVLSQEDLISRDDLRLPDEDSADPFEPGLPLEEVERRAIVQTLEACEGNISKAARVLDVSRRTLHYKLKEWESEDA